MSVNITWDSANFEWNNNSHTWDLVIEIVETIQSGVDVVTAIEQLEPEKKKRFIHLVCKVKGIETYSGQKTIKDDIKVSAKDVELVVKEILGIDLAVENINAR